MSLEYEPSSEQMLLRVFTTLSLPYPTLDTGSTPLPDPLIKPLPPP